MFLLTESRRCQTFDLWRRRFRVLNRALIVPALDEGRSTESGTAELQKLARDLGRTVPHLSLHDMLDWETMTPRWRRWMGRGTTGGGGDVE